MARPGPKPRPLNVAKLHGARPSRLPPPEPQPDPEVPAWLTPAEMFQWELVVTEQRTRRRTAPLDAALLAAYSSCLVQYIAASRELVAGGSFITDRDGDTRRHPSVIVCRGLESSMIRLSRALGLDADVAADDEREPTLEQLLNGPERLLS